MSANTKIEWCHATVNWWAGCTHVSPACDNCYAEKMAGRLWGTQWGADKPRHQFHGAAETLRALDRKAARLGQPLMVFHNSLSDFFDNAVPVQWRFEAMRSMVETRHLIHLLLTKRIGNATGMLEQSFRAVHGQREGWAYNVPPNIWIGATFCNQEEVDRDLTKLLDVPAAKRFASFEPLLGPVNLRFPTKLWGGDRCDHCCNGDRCDDRSHFDRPHCPFCRGTGKQKFLDWVIVGGESGHHARAMHPEWARSLRDQCEAAGVPFLFKQWGEWADFEHTPTAWWNNRTDAERATLVQCFVDGKAMNRIGKKTAGRLLDGRTWDGVPA